MTDRIKVAVGLSGGVDSSVSALLLKEQGYDVHGIFMKNWEEDDTDDYCAASADLKDVEALCTQLDIPLHTINFAAEYWDHVFEHFLAEYKAGRTPNPDILCNKHIKFKAFLDYAKTLDIDLIAMGHYAQKSLNETTGLYELHQGHYLPKDQSYFLCAINQEQLSHSLFPIGHLTKPEVRERAKQAGIAVHNKKDSTGICFIGERRFKTFLSEYLPAKPGNIITIDHQVIGQHDGLMYYTLGQRKGLSIGGVKNAKEAPWFVAAKDLERNELTVVQSHDHPMLYQDTLTAQDLNWIGGEVPKFPYSCQAKTRYRQAASPCTITSTESNQVHVTFEEPQWAITPGQSVVFYDGTVCLGGGVIQ